MVDVKSNIVVDDHKIKEEKKKEKDMDEEQKKVLYKNLKQRQAHRQRT